MSRIGKKPIPLPAGVTVNVSHTRLEISGPKGAMKRDVHSQMEVKVDESQRKILVHCDYKNPEDKALHGLTRSLINNMVIGVTKGYEKRLEILGVGYNAKVQGNELVFQIGYSHSIKMKIPEGITVTVPNPNTVILQGVNNELIGCFATEIKSVRPCNPYTLKGIKYADEVIKKKAGKSFASAK